MTKTNVMRLLDAAKIPYRAEEYAVDENDLNGMHAAEGTKESIHNLIRSYARQGMAVLMVSSDMPELIGASDRIVAMYEGRVSGELPLDQISEERIMALTSGMKIDTKEYAL